MKSSFDLAVQSYCFRHFKNNQTVAQKVRNIGVDKIEVCGVHADFNDPEAFKNVVSVYKNEGVSIVSIGVQTFQGSENEKNWFDCAAAAGAKHISAHFRIENYLAAIPKVRAWSREYGIRVGIHCHGGYAFGGQPDVLDHLVGLGGPEIGVCIDTAWAMQIGPELGDPIKWVGRYRGSIYGIHFKDFTFDRDGRWNDVVVGTGNLDLPGFTKALAESGFDGVSIVEYEADEENPEPALKRCVESMRADLA